MRLGSRVWLLTAVVAASAQLSSKVPNFDQLCGELSFVTPVSGGGMDSEALKNVKMELYLREVGIVCCRNSNPFFKTITGKEGAFEFKNVDPGRYWLAVHYHGKMFQMPIVFDPQSRTAASPACWQQVFHIDAKGHFTTGVRSDM